ncbi:hypothetical protein [Marinobacter fonticola]|uniref:hypothetical protein n=1 Tax=Marinobacter fonticola TaxID=2603215 RepID=UPI0011E712D2|nr:hypothetical protein [Marinobacter fonticola]
MGLVFSQVPLGGIKSCFSISLLFLVAFDPQVPFLPNGVGFTFLVAIFLLLPLAIKLQASDHVVRTIFKQSLPLLVVFLVAFAFIIFRTILSYGGNLEFVLSWFKAFFVFLACLFVFLIFYADRGLKFYIYSLFFVYALNVVVNFVSGTFPDYFTFLEYFRGEVISDSLGNNPYRDSFVSGSGYYSIGTAYGLIVLLFSYYLVKFRSNNVLLLVLLSFCSVAGFIAARTSFFALAPAFFYILKSRFIYFVLLSVVGAVILYLVIELPALQSYKAWMLSFFYFFDDASGAYLVNQMYFWPGDYAFLIGRGSVNDGTFIYTDAGYMQDVLFGGVLFLAIKLSLLLVFVLTFFKKSPFFVTLVVFAVLVFHFKGLFLYNNAQGMAAYYFTFFFLCRYFTRSYVFHPTEDG